MSSQYKAFVIDGKTKQRFRKLFGDRQAISNQRRYYDGGESPTKLNLGNGRVASDGPDVNITSNNVVGSTR